jgi:hypothetical protein
MIVHEVLSVRARNVLQAFFADTEIDPEWLNHKDLKRAIDRESSRARLTPQSALRRLRHCGARTWREISTFAGYETMPPHTCVCRICGKQS